MAQIKLLSFTFSISFSSCHVELLALLRTHYVLLYRPLILPFHLLKKTFAFSLCSPALPLRCVLKNPTQIPAPPSGLPSLTVQQVLAPSELYSLFQLSGSLAWLVNTSPGNRGTRDLVFHFLPRVHRLPFL